MKTTTGFVNLFNRHVLKCLNFRNLKIWFLIFLGLTLSQCNTDDSYDSSDSGLWGSFGIVLEDSLTEPSNYFTVALDNGKTLLPENYNAFSVSDSSRIYLTYSVLDSTVTSENTSYDVKISQMQSILFKKVIDYTNINPDTLGTDAVNVLQFGQKDNIVTFELGFWGSSSVHSFDLVKMHESESSDTLRLELYHNAYDDWSEYYYYTWISFDLSPLKEAGQDSVNIAISATAYDGSEYSQNSVYSF